MSDEGRVWQVWNEDGHCTVDGPMTGGNTLRLVPESRAVEAERERDEAQELAAAAVHDAEAVDEKLEAAERVLEEARAVIYDLVVAVPKPEEGTILWYALRNARGFLRRSSGGGGKMKRIIFCGGRDFTDYDAVEQRMRDLQAEHGPFVVIEGGQRGADRLSRRAARALGMPVATVEADWGWGKIAGPMRNRWMLELLPDRVEAFPDPDSKGTWDMVRLADAHKIPRNVHHG